MVYRFINTLKQSVCQQPLRHRRSPNRDLGTNQAKLVRNLLN
jgi:hypothetical protein